MAVNLINGKRYIGVTKHTLKFRRGQHIYAAMAGRNGCAIFMAAIRKYGEDSFEWSILGEFNNYKDALAAEVRFISEMKPEYNITKGGQGRSIPRTQEEKDKISRTLMGRKHPPEWKTRIKGRTLTPEAKEKLREIGLKSSRIMEFRHLGPEASSKQVVCLNTGDIYPSASEAGRTLNINKSMIIEICRRSPRRKAASDLVFRYFGDHHGGKEEAERILAERNENRRFNGKSCARSIICTTYGIEFSSISAAANEYCIPHQSIGAVCLGRKPSVYGLKFSYASSV